MLHIIPNNVMLLANNNECERANIEHQRNIITTTLQAGLKNAVDPKFHKSM